MKKIMHIMILISMLFLFHWGCEKKKVEEGKVTISYSYWGDVEDNKVTEAVVRKFEETHSKIRIKRLHIAGDYWTKLQTMIVGGMAPDVMWTPTSIDAISVGRGFYLDLQPYIERDNFNLSDFYLSTLEPYRFERKLCALPRCQNPYVIFYNKNLFDETGVLYPKENWNWDDFLSACKKLTKDSDGDGRIDQYGFLPSNPHYYVLFCFVWTNGGEIFNKERTKLFLDSPEAIEAIQWVTDLVNKHHVSPTPQQVAERGGYEMFMTGKVAMFPLGYWAVSTFRNIKHFEWDVAPMPQRREKTTLNNMAGFSIYSKTNYPEESWEFLKYLVSPEAQRIVAQSGHDVPILKSVANSLYFLDPTKPPANKKIFLEGAEKGKNVFLCIPPASVTSEWQAFCQELDLVWLGKKTAEEVCKKWTPIMEKNLSEMVTKVD